MEQVRAQAKAKGILHLYSASSRSCRGAVHVTARAGVWPIGRRLNLRPQADLWPTATRSLVCRF